MVTVEPLWSGHPWGNRGGGRLIWVCLPWNYYHRVVFLVNMESLQDNRDKLVFECFYHYSHLPFRTLICHHFFQNKFIFRVLNFGSPCNWGKENYESHRDIQKVVATALFSVFMRRNHKPKFNFIFPSQVLVSPDKRPYRNLTFQNVSARRGSSYCNRARLNFQDFALRDMNIAT